MERKITSLLQNKKIQLVVLFLIIVGSIIVRMYKLNNPIADWHSWRQVDTAAVTQIYLDNGLDLLHPRYYDISTIQTGYDNFEGLRFVEFPIFNLFHYVLVKIIPGVSFEALGRMVSILSAAFTTFFLYKIGRKVFGIWEGVMAAFFYAFLPFNIFFTRVILPDSLTVAFAVSTLWFFLCYLDKDRVIFLFTSAILFALALLTKPHSLFYITPVVILLIRKYSIKRMLQNVPLVASLAIVFIPFLLWRIWVNTGGNIRGIAHISWAFNGDGIRFRPAFWRWIFGERIGTMILGVWGVIPFAFGLLNLKKKHILVTTLSLGMFLYLSIIATANVRHDYYQTFIIPAIALLLGYGVVKLWTFQEFNKWLRRMVVAFSIFMIFIMGYDQVKGFYNINHYEIIIAGKAVDEMVPKDARVIAPYNGDTAFLYQTKRFGWPIIPTNIDDLIAKGADYYVSVNMDTDTNKFKQIYKTEVENDKFIILNLNEKI